MITLGGRGVAGPTGPTGATGPSGATGPAGPTNPLMIPIPGVAGAQTNAGSYAGTPVRIGCIVFDPSIYPTAVSGLSRTIFFRAVLEGTTGVTAHLELKNVDTGDSVTTLSATSTTPSRQVSGSLTVGAGASRIANALQTYEVLLKVSAPTPAGAGDSAKCTLAQLEVSYT